jgi:hypothetical protein
VSEGLCVPILIEETTGLARHREPVRLGVPLARGQLLDSASVLVVDEHKRVVPHQARVLASWSDRSVKWLLLDVLVSVAAHERSTLYLRDTRIAENNGPQPEVSIEGKEVRIEEQAGALVVNTGTAVFVVGGACGALLRAVSRNGVPMLDDRGARLSLHGCSGREYVAVAERSAVEEAGPLRSAVVIEGHFGDNPRSPFAFKARLVFFAGSAQLQLELQVRNPLSAAHPGGLWDLGDRGTVLFKDLSLSLAPAGRASEVRWYAEQPGGARTESPGDWLLYQDSSGGENWDSDNHVDGEGYSTVTFRGYRVSCSDSMGQMLIAEGDRATPCLRVTTDCAAIAATTLAFWENFPKALRWSNGTVSVGLFPGECQAPFALQGGEQKRHTVLLEFLRPEEPGSIPTQQRPLRASVDPIAVECSRAIGSFVAASRDSNQGYLRYVSSIVEGPHSFLAKRELIDEYGWRHFGDVYADHEAVYHRGPRPMVSHYNNQYDFIYGGLVRFLGTADARWWALASEAARHTIDIDIYHTDLDKAAYNHGLFWHTAHHKPAATSTHRTYSRRTGRGLLYGGGPSNEHNYTSGLLLYFYLSGDPEAACVVRELGEWVIAMDDGSRSALGLIDPSPTGLASSTANPTYHKAGRGAGNSINALLDNYTLDGERRYLDKAEQLIGRCIHPSDDIDALDLLSEPELRWSYLVFLQALGKYLHLKLELGEIDYMFHYGRACLLHYAQWMAMHEAPYKQALNRVKHPTETWSAQDMRKAHVLHLAAEFAPPAQRKELHASAAFFFKRSLGDVLSFRSAFLTRPQVILCVCGSPHAYFQAHPTAGMEFEESPHQFGQPETFTPQRQRCRAALPRKMHLLAIVLARVGFERFIPLRRRSSPSRI